MNCEPIAAEGNLYPVEPLAKEVVVDLGLNHRYFRRRNPGTGNDFASRHRTSSCALCEAVPKKIRN